MTTSDRGFTLLEVMAAVAIVAIVFTTLARVASEGLRSEGSSKRRLEASLLADAALADVEAQLQSGTELDMGSRETDEDPFTVEVEVSTFDLAAAIPLEDASEGNSVSSLLAGSDGGSAESPLRQIDIRVFWNEGFEEYQVVRTTFGIDQAAIQNLLGGAVAAAEAAPVGVGASR